jgi:hypothetical protein
MVEFPAVTPVTTPVADPTVALALLLLHVPPVVLLARVVVCPTHTLAEPVLAGRAASTVTTVVA